MDKKELVNQYKNRAQTGGVFAIKNTLRDKWYVDATVDLKAAQNRFAFFGSTHLKLAEDYKAQGGAGFAFTVLEELQKGETQTDRAFKDDLSLLKTIWLEKLTGQDLY
ncbi:MAG: GIY-YIG nuclease family protein [Clostridiales bacterium]|nr:GIY-YIG nuclease family protein [Clostridiales bacterium]